MKGRPIAYFQAIALLIIASLSQRTFYVAGIKGAGQQLRQKRPLKIAAKTVHHYADKDVPKTRGDSRRERQLQQSTSTAGGNSNFGAFEGGANTPPTEYVISGSDLRVPSLAPNVITTPTTAVPSQAPVLSASEKAYNTANTVIAGVNGNLDRGNGSSKGSTRSKTGSYATSSANPAAPKGSKKSYTISGAEATPRKKAKSKSGKKTKSATKLAKSSTGKASATGSYYAATSSSGKAGKGGKGGKGKSGVAGVEGTSEDGSTSTVSSGYEAPSGSSSPAPVSNAVGAPSPYAAPSGISYPQMGTNGNALIDCSAIREGTAATDAPNRKSFRVDANWILDETADFDQVAASVQNYLQFEVAPAIAGCAFNGRNRRRLQFLPNAQSLVSNIQFGTPSADATGKLALLCYGF